MDCSELGDWIAVNTPIGWRTGYSDPTAVDAAARMLQLGAEAWTQLLLIKRVLVDAGLFAVDELDGDVAQRLSNRLSEVPPYVHALLDAYLGGEPLDFAGHPVPTAVRRRLDGELRAAALVGVPPGGRA